MLLNIKAADSWELCTKLHITQWDENESTIWDLATFSGSNLTFHWFIGKLWVESNNIHISFTLSSLYNWIALNKDCLYLFYRRVRGKSQVFRVGFHFFLISSKILRIITRNFMFLGLLEPSSRSKLLNRLTLKFNF